MDKNYKEIIKKEYVRCANDPVYFLKKYSFIQHPIKGKIPFALYDFQEKTVEEFILLSPNTTPFSSIFVTCLLVMTSTPIDSS